MVRLGGVVLPGRGDAAVVRVETTQKGLALKADCNSRFVFLDPVRGRPAGGRGVRAATSPASAASRSGSPTASTSATREKPEIMWQFAEACRGICRRLPRAGRPGRLRQRQPLQRDRRPGHLPHADHRRGRAGPGRGAPLRGDLPQRGATGSRCSGTTRGELGGSEYLVAFHGKTAGRPPRLDARAELALQAAVRELVRDGTLSSRARLQRGRARGGARRVLHDGPGAIRRRPRPARPRRGAAARVPLRRGRLAGDRLLRPGETGPGRGGAPEGGRPLRRGRRGRGPGPGHRGTGDRERPVAGQGVPERAPGDCPARTDGPSSGAEAGGDSRQPRRRSRPRQRERREGEARPQSNAQNSSGSMGFKLDSTGFFAVDPNLDPMDPWLAGPFDSAAPRLRSGGCHPAARSGVVSDSSALLRLEGNPICSSR